MADLTGKKVLIMATDGFEQSELFKPREALLDAGASVKLASIKTDPIQGVVHDDKQAETITPDMTLDQVEAANYDMLVLPGGVGNPDKMRMEARAPEIIRAFLDAGKPVAAICHGPWTLIDAGLVMGRQVTSWPSLRTDLENAGAQWHDKEVVADGQLITSRKPDDIPAFTQALIDRLVA